MARPASSERDTSIRTYRAKRDFGVTSEPAPREPGPEKPEGEGVGPQGPAAEQVAGQSRAGAPIFVVQKHHAHRAGLHWDFRLEHGNVLWSWAVRKGPSLDPTHKRIAAHVEDHPLDYAEFQGTIPQGQYGAGTVETWDRGTWRPIIDPDAGLRNGEIKFFLHGTRLNGKFTLVRLRPKPNERGRQDNWLLIKGHDEHEREGADAQALEAAIALPVPGARAQAGGKPAAAASAGETGADRKTLKGRGKPPAPAATRGGVPERPMPQLASVADAPPEEDGWLSEIKFDGYRLMAAMQNGVARLTTRNGHDWTDRLPAVAAAIQRLQVGSAVVDGELVALEDGGMSSFSALQAALSNGRDQTLVFYLFDLLHLDGWDLRPCALRDRKRLLQPLDGWTGMLRYSDHHGGDAARMRQAACEMKLEGIICKRADAPYTVGRSRTWLKVKCQCREELVVIGWTPPDGSRAGLGALHLGYHDAEGNLHYAGGVGSGFSDDELARLRDKLDHLAMAPASSLLVAGDELERTINWVEPALVAETSFTAWSAAGRVRHAVYLGLREDKPAREVVRPVVNPEAERRRIAPKQPRGGEARKSPIIAIPPKRTARPERSGAATHPAGRTGSAAVGAIVTAPAPRARSETIEGVTITHADRPLWPGGAAGNGGITKRDLAEYWLKVADHALPGLAKRPLAILRCPEGVQGEHFFQKHGHGTLPPSCREGSADKAPYLAIDDVHGLVGMAQMSAVELHVWGATEADALHPDQLVFDLDPGEDVAFPAIVAAALDLRKELEAVGLASFCRTSGGKGLHLVVPLRAEQPWEPVRAFCKAFAEAMSAAHPDKYLSVVKKAERRGRILIDWLRNGLGSTAVGSFCPRARLGAGVATPLAWREVTAKLDPGAFTVLTVPRRLAKLRADPWGEFERSRASLPRAPEVGSKGSVPAGKARILTAKAPRARGG